MSTQATDKKISHLHQILAVEPVRGNEYDAVQKETATNFAKAQDFYDGSTKSLKMKDDTRTYEEEAAKSEKLPRTTVKERVKYNLDAFAKYMNVSATKELTNTLAKADVVVNGKTILTDVPATALLQIEKRLQAVRTLFLGIPTLDNSKKWVLNEKTGWWEAPEEVTTKTEKNMRPIILVPPTDKHPAQVEKVTEDIVVGKYTTLPMSGRFTSEQKHKLLKKVEALLEAVIIARHSANNQEVQQSQIGDDVVKYLLED
jgi:hypothetical protein